MNKPLLERAAQSGNDDQGQKKNGNGADRLHSVDVVLIEPLDDLGHGLGPNAADQRLTHH